MAPIHDQKLMHIHKKEWLTKSNYKILSKNAPWKGYYTGDHIIAIDVDSLVFMYMRQGMRSKACAKALASAYASLKNSHLIYSTGVPRLKRALYDERQLLGTPYNDRDHVRDKTMGHLLRKYPIDRSRCIGSKEADKYCGKNYIYILTEDVDVFLFGNPKTTIIHPLTYRTLTCKDYYMAHGIRTHTDFLDIAIGLGTDYNYGIKGIGIATLHKIIVDMDYRNITEYICSQCNIAEPHNKWYPRMYLRVMEYLQSNF